MVDEGETAFYFHHGSGMVSWVSKQTFQGGGVFFLVFGGCSQSRNGSLKNEPIFLVTENHRPGPNSKPSIFGFQPVQFLSHCTHNLGKELS